MEFQGQPATFDAVIRAAMEDGTISFASFADTIDAGDFKRVRDISEPFDAETDDDER